MNDDYDRVVMLQEQLERLTKDMGEMRKDYNELRTLQQIDHATLEARDKDLAAKDKEIATLRDSCTKLKAEKDHVEAMRVHDEGLADKAKADLVTAAVAREKELRATRQERNELQERNDLKKQKLEELEEELNELYGTIRDHEENADLVEHYEKRQEEMSTDMDKLRELMEDSNRLLLVKDERITQLEKQLQRERERIHKAAEAAEAAEAARSSSPAYDDHYQQVDSLQDELAEAEEAFEYSLDSLQSEDDYAPQPLELSHIESVLNYAPKAPQKPARAPANLALAPIREAAKAVPKQAIEPEYFVEAPPAFWESWWVLFFLVLGFLWTFRQPDGPSSVTVGAYYNGAFGNDRSLAGFPISSGIGDTGVTEALGRLVAITVTSWEGWLGIVGASLY
ncbi:hypothetical protein IQ07DRAFT_586035 [Pyrenochaeta sp. DS3sAY3a]|nr:hypothetical protein IQ07DRAFT_586035 [Pyrenochaeta sp. DS3sAY3a]